MSFGITKTIPASRGDQGINSLYDGSITEFEFHMAGNPSKLAVGDYVYTIFKDQLHGRLEITQLVSGAANPKSGKPRTLILVRCPGERLKEPRPKKGHRGTRYFDGEGWQQ
ncbi:MAG: hypothetical protein AAF541_06280 [Pseudomonadota bacterium]